MAAGVVRADKAAEVDQRQQEAAGENEVRVC
jgi:hypothetical protein